MGELGIQPLDQQQTEIAGLGGQGEQGELVGRLHRLAAGDVDELDMGLEQPGQPTQLLGLGDGEPQPAVKGDLADQH